MKRTAWGLFLIIIMTNFLLASCVSTIITKSNPVWEETVNIPGTNEDDLYMLIYLWACNGFRHRDLVLTESNQTSFTFNLEFDDYFPLDEDLTRMRSDVSVRVNNNSYTIRFSFRNKQRLGYNFNYSSLMVSAFNQTKEVWQEYAVNLRNYVTSNIENISDPFERNLVNDPDNINAWHTFAARQANANMRYGFNDGLGGFYNEAMSIYQYLAAIDPANEYVLENIRICQELVTLQSNRWKSKFAGGISLAEAHQRDVERNRQELNQSVNNYLAQNAQRTQIRGDGGNNSGGNTQSNDTQSTRDYQGQYDRWAQRVRGYVSSLDLMDKGTSSYTLTKRNLRAAQREMRNIRNEARSNGAPVTYNDWESFSP